MKLFSKIPFSSKGLTLSSIVFLLVTIAYTVLSYQQWVTGFVPTYDLGIFTQLTRAYAALQAPIVPIKNVDFNLLGDHFHPLLAVMAPIYALFPSAFTLLVIQGVLLGLSAAIFGYGLYRLFILFITHRVLAPISQSMWQQRFYGALPYLGSLGGGLAYGLSWGLQNAQFVQFHEISWAVLLLSIGLYYFIGGRRYGRAALWVCLIVFVKEDLGLTVAIFGFVLMWRVGRDKLEFSRSFPFIHTKSIEKPSREKNRGFKQWMRAHQWVYGLFLVVWGVFWLWFATSIFIPAFNENQKYGYTGKSGVSDLLSNPVGTVGEIFSNQAKLSTMILVIVVVAGGVFFSPLVFLAAPTLGWRFLSPESLYWWPGAHYDALIMPIAFFCLADFIHKIYLWATTPQNSMEAVRSRWQKVIGKVFKSQGEEYYEPSLISPYNKVLTPHESFGFKVKKALSYYGVYWTMPLIIIAGVVTMFIAPVHTIFIHDDYEPSEVKKSVMEVAEMIPENSLVASDVAFMNYLVDAQSRMDSGADPINTLYWARRPPKNPPDYIALNMDPKKEQYPQYSDNEKRIDDLVRAAELHHKGAKYTLIYNKNNIQLAKRIK